MDIVAPEVLLSQLYRAVEVVASPAEAQLDWCLQGSVAVPVDEVFQSLGDCVFAFLPRLREAGLLDPRAEDLLQDLMSYFGEMRELDHSILWSDEGLHEPEWDEARRRARLILPLLKEPT